MPMRIELPEWGSNSAKSVCAALACCGAVLSTKVMARASASAVSLQYTGDEGWKIYRYLRCLLHRDRRQLIAFVNHKV